jgi:phosphoribosylamine---glycine ligase
MRVLFIDRAGDGGLDIAMRSHDLGHTVKYFLRDFDRQKRPIGLGLVDLVDDWRKWARWADLVVALQNDLYMVELERLRAEGCRVIGGSPTSAAWESDRGLGMKVFSKAGIPVPAYREFSDYQSAIAYVKRQDAAFVSKPSGHCDDKALSYVAKSPHDLVYMLERWQKAGKRAGLEFILQEKIEGIEFAVGAWFGPSGFAPGREENFEHKKLMPGDKGPNTGEMGTVMRYVRNSKLARQVLDPLEPFLAEIGYVGNIDVNCIIDADGHAWPLEFTTRCGWPAYNIEIALFAVDPIEFLAGLADGRPPRAAHRYEKTAVGIVLAIPDFPYSHATRKEVIGVPVYGLTPELLEHIHPCEMMMGEAPHSVGGRIVTEPCLVTAGDYVLVATGLGDGVREARRACYRVIENISLPASPFWRDDIGERVMKEIPKLQAHGFASDWVV